MFLFIGKFLYFTFIFEKLILIIVRFLADSFFFQHLEYAISLWIHCSLCNFRNSLLGVHLYVTNRFSCCFPAFLLVFSFSIMMCLGMDLCIILVRICWAYWMCILMFFIKMGNFDFSHCFFEYFFLFLFPFFSLVPITHMLI